MRFYDGQHRFYPGIDLHAIFMHVCVLDAAGNVVYDHNLPCHFETLLKVIAPFRERDFAPRLPSRRANPARRNRVF